MALLTRIGLVTAGLLALAGLSSAQAAPATSPTAPGAAAGPTPQELAAFRQWKASQQEKARTAIAQAETLGVESSLSGVAHFRGTWTQQLMGVSVVIGLDGTGDSKKFTATQKAITNMLRKAGIDSDAAGVSSANCALVMVTCDLPAFSTPAQKLDVTVSSVGDAKSLRGGTLILSGLKPGTGEDVIMTAQGAVTTGGMAVSAGGNSQSRGFTTVGKVTNGGTVLQAVATKTVFDGKMYLDLDQADPVTAHRLEVRINRLNPEFEARALGSGTIELKLPNNMTSNQAQSMLMEMDVQTNTEARVVIDSRTGTIIIGGNVRVAPCLIASGKLSVKVEEQIDVSQPMAFSNGTTTTTANQKLSVGDDTAQFAVMRPNTTIADLAIIFQTLKLKADDIISILEAMHSQGALKAKVVAQ